MAMTADKPISKWRNFASWSIAGGVTGIGIAVLASWLGQGLSPAALFPAEADPRAVLALLLSMAVVGLSSRNTPFSWRGLRNFTILAASASAIAILAISAVRGGAFGTLGASQWVAAGAGLVLVFFAACFGFVNLAARKGWDLLEPDQVEILRERSRLGLLSWAAVAAMGLMLVLLSLAGPGSVIAAAPALAGLLALTAITTGLSIAAWRQMDELDRTLSYEAGNVAFYLVLLLGGGWAMLAHLGFVPAAAPLDWLTILALIAFPASFVAAGRRGLLKQR
jgi:hypothetical protein